MRKKTSEIRLCIDFRNLNKVSLKDNYPLPKMDHILQRVVGTSRMSLLDGYFGYNQILVHEDDTDKMAFTTPWGTFHYAKMPFGLKNVGATFQQAMDIAFANEKDRCRKYGISLNPKKSLFTMDEGKLLDHIISKEGIRIDPARVEAILKIDFPSSKKETQAFNSKMNFLHHFVPNLAEHLMEITNMLKKDSVIKWTEEAIKSFNLIDPEGRRGKWIAALLEYDLEIKPTKLIKGQGLEKLMAESNLHALDINLIATMSEEDEDNSPVQVSEIFIHSPWYFDNVYVLQNLSPPPGMAKNKSRTLKLKAAKFCIMNTALYWKDPIDMLLNCLVEEEAKRVMGDFHKGDCGGHLFWKTTANKILKVGYYWPTLFVDVYKIVTSCHECQLF
eukprot:PITA_02803